VRSAYSLFGLASALVTAIVFVVHVYPDCVSPCSLQVLICVRSVF